MKKLILPCDCVGGEKYCGRMEVWKDKWKGEYDIEFNLYERKKKTVVAGVWLKPASVKKLIKFLE